MSDRDAIVTNWGADGFFFTEAARGGSLPWRVGGSKLEGDALGPVRHAHDDAAEYYFMFSGSAHVETGGEEFVLEEGQLGYIPPDAPHNFLGPASGADACLFCVVGPNLTFNKWRVKDFKPGSESLRMAVGTPFEEDPLPAGGTLAARAVTLSPARRRSPSPLRDSRSSTCPSRARCRSACSAAFMARSTPEPTFTYATACGMSSARRARQRRCSDSTVVSRRGRECQGRLTPNNAARIHVGHRRKGLQSAAVPHASVREGRHRRQAKNHRWPDLRDRTCVIPAGAGVVTRSGRPF